MIDKVLQIWD